MGQRSEIERGALSFMIVSYCSTKLNYIPMTKKEEVLKPELEMKVFHEAIYSGKELMEVVGIREAEVELQGDYSGGTNAVLQKDWLPIKGLFRLRLVCPEHQKGGAGSCQLSNVHCGYPDCEPYVDVNENKL